MANESNAHPEGEVRGLLRGIISDIQVLTRQQLALLRRDIKHEFGEAREATFVLTAGLVVAATGSLLLCVMLVHLLAQMTPALPLWACYGIVGGPIVILGGILMLTGLKKFGNVDTSPTESFQHLRKKFNE